MLKILIPLLLLIAFTSQSMATSDGCYEKLTDFYTEDSRNFTVNLGDLDMRDYGKDYLAEAIYIIRELLDEVGCKRNDINFGKGIFGKSGHKCRSLVPGKVHTTVCYIESNLGYFFVTKDFLDNANVTYARWD